MADTMVSPLVERALRVRDSISLDDIAAHGLLRRRDRYFLNISYPSMQAMGEIDPAVVADAWRAHSGTQEIALYVHIPFCSALCYYCHYYKVFGAPEALVEQYLNSLALEFARLAKAGPSLVARSIYIGGGTPSYLSAPQIRRLFQLIRQHVSIPDDIEVSFEVHPENATPTLFELLHREGVNRLNIGVESFDPKILANENRRHTMEDAKRAVTQARATGLHNINIDLIYGLRYQTVEGWERTLSTATDLEVASVCAYYLRLKQTTPEFKKYRAGAEDFPSEDDLLLMHIMTFEHMAASGYSQKIVDWFIKDAKYYHTYQQHNWQRTDEVPLVGIGASAYSYLDGIQYYNVNDLKEYMSRMENNLPAINRGEHLSSTDSRMRRSLMLGLKTAVDRSAFSACYGIDVLDAFPAECELLLRLGLVEMAPEKLTLSYTGMLFADEIGQLFYSKEMRLRMERIDPTLISTTLPKVNPFRSLAPKVGTAIPA